MRGNFRGGQRGRGGGGNRFGDRPQYNEIPDRVVECCQYEYPCEEYLVCKSLITKIPYFNAGIFLENKVMIGKVDEIFGPIQDFFFSVKPKEEVKAQSLSQHQKLYIDPAKLLPLERFLPKPAGSAGSIPSRGGGGRGRGRGGGRGGGFRGGRGGSRGGGFRGGRGGGSFSRGRGARR